MLRRRLAGWWMPLVFLLVACSNGESNSGTTSPTGTRQPNSPVSASVVPERTAAAASATAGVASQQPFGPRSADLVYEFEEKCAPQVPETGFANYEQTREDLRCAVTQFTWPVNRVPDQEDLDAIFSQLGADSDFRDADFEQGWGYMMVGGVNSCQWKLTWLDGYSSGNQRVLDEATYWLSEFFPNIEQHIPDYPSELFDSSTIESTRAEGRAAASGNASLLRTTSARCVDLQDDGATLNHIFAETRRHVGVLAGTDYVFMA